MLEVVDPKNTLKALWQLMRMDKPIGWLLLLWPTLWALWLAAGGFPGWFLLAIFVGGVLLMRSAGCIINDWADRPYDGRVARTQGRPLVTGRIDSRTALLAAGVLVLSAFILVLQLNALTIALSFIAVALAVIYPFLKRITHLPQVWLGLAFSWGIPMAFSAVQNHVPLEAWWLFASTLLWVVAYDGMYAMVDREDDLKIGVKSIAILAGAYDVVIFTGLQVLFLLSLGLMGWVLGLKPPYFIGLLFALGSVIYQFRLIRTRCSHDCFQAFLNNHWLGLAIFLGVISS